LADIEAELSEYYGDVWNLDEMTDEDWFGIVSLAADYAVESGWCDPSLEDCYTVWDDEYGFVSVCDPTVYDCGEGYLGPDYFAEEEYADDSGEEVDDSGSEDESVDDSDAETDDSGEDESVDDSGSEESVDDSGSEDTSTEDGSGDDGSSEDSGGDESSDDGGDESGEG
jgi:hypothetical protein